MAAPIQPALPPARAGRPPRCLGLYRLVSLNEDGGSPGCPRSRSLVVEEGALLHPPVTAPHLQRPGPEARGTCRQSMELWAGVSPWKGSRY